MSKTIKCQTENHDNPEVTIQCGHVLILLTQHSSLLEPLSLPLPVVLVRLPIAGPC